MTLGSLGTAHCFRVTQAFFGGTAAGGPDAAPPRAEGATLVKNTGFFVAPPLTVPSDGAAGAAAGPAPRRKNDGIGFCHAPIVDGAIEEVAEGVNNMTVAG